MDIKNLKTGDILLVSSHLSWNPISVFGLLIEWFTGRPYSHIGMILKDPTWIKPEMTGLYLWESSWHGTRDPQDDKIKLGVQITPLEEVLNERRCTFYIRQLKVGREKLTVPILKKIHKMVYEKPYDLHPIDWLEAYLRKDFCSRKEDRFFCSALVACIFTEAGILASDTDWSIIRPSDFDDNNRLIWIDENPLDELIQLN